ncbi:hypothetical protein BDY19DRAFT_990009 [Irpex rosettiformis]|uniref:Uncharacterized protein n=1 Tax=Irpex rosettiformis TaxID=378272 RepID=A0ACB8UGF1_9APHY|nr:hypothetical protein BDY19DRAFT_990009 [Irpex rosettiformis]
MALDWTQLVTVLKSEDREHYKLTFQDALVAAATPDHKYLITSPNMDYIPAPSWGRLNVSLKANGKFGVEDPLLWPQMYVPSSRWRSLACIPRDGHPRRRLDLWHSPTADVLDAASAPGLYVMKRSMRQTLRNFVEELNRDVESFEESKGPSSHLRWLQLTVNNALDCLEVPSTERDIVRQLSTLERFCCVLVAWLTWDSLFSYLDGAAAPRIVRSDLMGCFTTSLSVVGELYRAGIPVWYMRLMSTVNSSIHVVSCISLRSPEFIVTDPGSFGYRPIYQGPPGQAQIEAILCASNQYVDVEPLPFPEAYHDRGTASQRQAAVELLGLPAASSSQAGPSRISTSSLATTKKKNKKNKKVDPYYRPSLPKTDPNVAQKFNDPLNPCVPPLLNGWLSALQQGSDELQASKNSWPLWVPEPQMVTGSPSQVRRQRYVLHWLMIRESWWSFLQNPNLQTAMMSRWWRAYLDDGFAPSPKIHGDHEAARKKAVEVLTSVFRGAPFNPADLRPTWFSQPVSAVDDALCCQVAWEISEMGFRVELVKLDLAFLGISKLVPAVAAQRNEWLLQVFPGSSPLRMAAYPSTNTGLASPAALERSKSLEGLRLLMLSWPDCPEQLKASAPLDQVSEGTLASLEPVVKSFYVRSFVRIANRPPILPRQRPDVSPLFASPSSPPPLSPPPSPQSPPTSHLHHTPASPTMHSSSPSSSTNTSAPYVHSPVPSSLIPGSNPSFLHASASSLPRTYTPAPPTPRLQSSSPPW